MAQEKKTRSSNSGGSKNPSGVQETYKASARGTLLSCLQEKSERSRTSAKQLISSGRVCVDRVVVSLPTAEVGVGALVTVHRSAPPRPFSHPLIDKVWENEDYLVVYKDAGIATVNTAHKDREDTALWLLSKNLKLSDPQGKLFMVNRLDKSTSGYIIFAKNVDAKDQMNKQWSRQVSRQTFAACVEGEINGCDFRLSAKPPKNKEKDEDRGRRLREVEAQVAVKKSSAHGGLHVVEIEVHGERIFSLRKIFADNKLSIFGDVRSHSNYVMKDRIALQQIRLELTLPQNGRHLSFERAFPSHFYSFLRGDKGVIDNLGLQRKKEE